MDGRFAGVPTPMSDQLVQHYRDTLTAHADDPGLGACPSCRRSRCDEWRWAYEQLVTAGLLAGLPEAGTARAVPDHNRDHRGPGGYAARSPERW